MKEFLNKRVVKIAIIVLICICAVILLCVAYYNPFKVTESEPSSVTYSEDKEKVTGKRYNDSVSISDYSYDELSENMQKFTEIAEEYGYHYYGAYNETNDEDHKDESRYKEITCLPDDTGSVDNNGFITYYDFKDSSEALECFNNKAGTVGLEVKSNNGEYIAEQSYDSETATSGIYLYLSGKVLLEGYAYTDSADDIVKEVILKTRRG